LGTFVLVVDTSVEIVTESEVEFVPGTSRVMVPIALWKWKLVAGSAEPTELELKAQIRLTVGPAGAYKPLR
jgi:hypothetical protein